MNNWSRLTSQTNEAVPPERIQVRGIDVLPHHYAIWCTVGDDTKSFANEIVSRRWSEDGAKIWIMLDTHNFDSFSPDEMVWVVPLDPSPYTASLRDKWAKDAEEFLSKRPIKKEPLITQLENKLAGYLLDLAANEFTRHGCNDLDLVRDVGLTPEESQEVQRALYQWKNDPEGSPPDERPDYHYAMDWMLMRMLAERLKAPKEKP